MSTFPPERDPVASIIVVGLGDAPRLGACLEALAASVNVPFEVLVVLNDPTPDLAFRLEREVVGAHVFPFRANLGFGGAVNFAATRARGEYIVLLNDDCVVTSRWLEPLIDTVRRRDRCGIVGSTNLHPDGTLQEAGSLVWSDGSTMSVGDGLRPGYMQFERIVDYCSGGALLVRRDVWDVLRGMDEAFYPAYYEDVDLCLRAAEKGWQTWYQPHSSVVHHRSTSTTYSLRVFLMERAKKTFQGKWAHVLADRDPAGTVEKSIWKAMGSPIRLLVIDDRIPDSARGAGMGRMYDTLVELASDTGLQVTFHPRLPPAEPNAAIPVPGVRLVVDLDAHLDTHGVAFDVLVVSRPDNFDLYRELIEARLPDVPLVYDAEALFHRRLEMQADLRPVGRQDLLQEASTMRDLESSLMDRADHVVCISHEEADRARALSTTPVHVVEPWLADPDPTGSPYEERAHIGFVAGWLAGRGSPNADGLLWFAAEVLPRVRARVPDCRLLVTGHNPPTDVSWLQGAAVDFVGGLRDLRAFYDSIRVAISPTRFGAGVKLKTVEALQYGVPVVSTPEGSAGLPSTLSAAVWVADDPIAFADSVIALLEDRSTWERCRSICVDAHDIRAFNNSGVGQWPALIRLAHSSRATVEAID